MFGGEGFPMVQGSEPRLTFRQAYLAMFEFLRQHHIRGLSESEEIGGLLGGLSLLADGQPADPAYLADWADAVRAVLAAEAFPPGYREADFRLVADTAPGAAADGGA